MGSITISVYLSAYNREADPPEKGVVKYAAEDERSPKILLRERRGIDGVWDVCILDLPTHVRKIKPASLGEALAYACLWHCFKRAPSWPM